MNKVATKRCVCSSPGETVSLAEDLAASLKGGSVVALVGPLGSGKTVFVKGLAAGLGLAPGAAVSPTFTLINEYDGDVPLYHVDLYRLQSRAEVDELGLEEYFDGRGIVAVEWAEKAAHLLPPDSIFVHFRRLGSTGREITIES